MLLLSMAIILNSMCIPARADGEPMHEKGIISYSDPIGETIPFRLTVTLGENDGGVKNVANLEYSNDPYTDSRGELEDDASICTTRLLIAKSGSDGGALYGAEFQLYKLYNGEYVPVNYLSDPDEKEGHLLPIFTCVKGEITDEDTGESVNIPYWMFGGLSDGEYMIKETKTPDGYNSIKQPIKFQVKMVDGVPQFKITDCGEGDLINAAKDDVLETKTLSAYIHITPDGPDPFDPEDDDKFECVYAIDGDKFFTNNISGYLYHQLKERDPDTEPDDYWVYLGMDGKYGDVYEEYGDLYEYTDVKRFEFPEQITAFTLRVSNTGGDAEHVTLPHTGLYGTKNFYRIGSVMVLAAGILLVTRRRMRYSENE